MSSILRPSSKRFFAFSIFLFCYFFLLIDTQAQHQEPVVIDVYPGVANSSNPSELTAIGDKLIFNATGSGLGREPYISDGTSAGTSLLRDIASGSNSSSASYFTEFKIGADTYAYYFVNDDSNSGVLYRTNISDNTTEFVVNVNPLGSESSNAGAGNGKFLVNVGGTLFFSGQDPTGRQELFKSDGTAGGTVLVKDINANFVTGSAGPTRPSDPQNLTNINGTLFFTADDQGVGSSAESVNRELWVSDGTEAGTQMVRDIDMDNMTSSNPTNLVEKDGLCYFFADGGTGITIWRSDGTASGTFEVPLPAGTTVDATAGLVNSNNILFFAATDATRGTELWISDGVNAGPLDLNAGTDSSNPRNFVSVNGECYFSAAAATTGAELWRSNGTVSGTVLVKDIFPGFFGSSPEQLTAVRGLVSGVTTEILYFVALTGSEGFELWKSNGTDAGTVMVKDFFPDPDQRGSNISDLTAVPIKTDKDGLALAAFENNVIGTELWFAEPCPTAEITYASATLCKNAGSAVVTLTSPEGADVTGGTYTATGGLPIDGSTGAITLNESLTSGAYTVTYKATKGICDIETSTIVTLVDGGSSPTEEVNTLVNGFNFNTASTSTSDGTASMVISPNGQYLYVPDEKNHVIKRVEISSGTVSVIAGTSGNNNSGNGPVDGNGAAARFNFPTGLAIDVSGTLYVADKDNNAIRKIVDPDGTATVTTIVGTTGGDAGDVIGTTTAARFREPSDVEIDFSNNLYVADKNNHKIKKIDLNTNTVSILAGPPIGSVTFPSGAVDGASTIAQFFFPTSIALDLSGNLYVADRHNNIIRRVLTSDGTTSTFAGDISQTTPGSTNGAAANARFNHPSGITVDKEGNVYVADTRNHLIRKISGGNVTTLAGTGSAGSTDNNFALSVQFNFPTGVFADLEQNIYISDKTNQSIRKYFINNPSGKVTAGQQVCAGSSGSLTLSGHSGSVTKWQSSTDAVNWTDIANTTNTLAYTNIGANTFYRAFVQDGACAPEPSNYAILLIAGPNAPVSGGDETRCGTGTVTLTATGSSDGNYRWYEMATGGASLESNASFTTPSLAVGNHTYYVAIAGATCESARVPVNITVNANPTPTVTGTNTVCPGQTETYTTADNAGSNYNWEITNPAIGSITAGQGTASVTIEWGTTPAAGTLTVTETTGDGCSVTSPALNMTINSVATDPGVTDVSRCGTGTVTLTASGATGAQKYRWYADATTTTVEKESANATDPDFITPSISATTEYYVSIIDGICESNRVRITATVLGSTPTDPTVVAVPDTRCGAGDATFQASGAAAGQVYKWYDDPTAGNLLKTSTDESDDTFITGVTSDATYYVSISNTICAGESNRVAATITVTTTGGATPTVTDVSRCGIGAVNINATKSDGAPLGAGEEFRWYVSSTEPTAFENNTGSLIVANLAATTSYFVSFYNGSCESDRVEVTATVTTLAPPTAIDGSRCDPGAVTLSANGAIAGQRYFWYDAAVGGSLVHVSTNESDNTYTTPSITSNQSVYVSIVNDNGTPGDFSDDCNSDRTEVTAFINPPGTVPNAPAVVAIPTTRCGTGDFVLDASGATGGQVYVWFDNATGTGAPLKTSADHLDTTYTASAVAANTSFYVRVLDASCGNTESTLTKVDVTVAAAVADPGVTAADRCGNGMVTLTASGGTNGQYRWYASTTSTDVLATTPDYTTPDLNTTTTYYVSIFNGTCETNRVAVTATINSAPVAEISGTNLACNDQTVRYEANSTGNTYNWTIDNATVVSGGGAADNFVEVRWDAAATSGKITLEESIGTCTSQDETNFSLKPLPNPAIAGATANCITEQATYSTTLNAGNTYTWTVVGGTIDANGAGTYTALDANSINVTCSTTATVKSVSVEENNGACSETATANVNPTPVISGPTTACQNVAGTAYSTTLNTGNTYVWMVTGGTIDANGTNTITGVDMSQVAITWTDPTTGSLVVTETDGLGCNTTTSAYNVSIFTKPSAPAFTGDTDICAFTDGTDYQATYTIDVANSNYIYSWSIVNASDGQIVSAANADSTSITIRWSNNLPFNAMDVATVKLQVAAKIKSTDCIGDANEQDISVKRTPIKPQLISTQDSVYVNTIRTYATTTNNTGSTYNWTVRGGTIVGVANTHQITVKWGGTATTGEVFVTEDVRGCINNSDTATVRVFSYDITARPLSTTLCEGGQVRLQAIDANAVRFDWYDAPTGGNKVGESTNNGSSSDTLRVTQNTVGNFVYYATPITGSGVNGADDSGGDNERAATPFSVVVNDPTNFTIVGDTTNAQFCTTNGAGGGMVTLTTVSGGFSGAPYTYLWTKAGDASYNATTKDITDLTPGTYTVQVTDAGGCTSNLISFVIEDRRQFVTDALITPTSTGNILLNAARDTVTVTVGESVTLAATATDAATYVWTADTDADVANISDGTLASPVMTPKQTTKYTLVLTNNKGCDTTLSIVARVLSYQVFVPTMFTPNNDNKNDRFQVFGNQVGELELKVFNREGKLVYESKNMDEFLGSNEFGIKTSETATKGWDGTFENNPLPKGNYVWYLTGKFKNGVEIKQSGNVLLVR